MPEFSRKYEKELWEGGLAAIDILHTMVNTEVTVGNHRNIPSGIITLYLLTLVPLLQRLETEGGTFEERMEKADAIAAGISFAKTRSDEPETLEAIEIVLRTLTGRSRPLAAVGGFDHHSDPRLCDYTYGGRIPG